MRIFYGFAKWLPKKDDQKEGRLWQKSWNVSFSQNYMLIKAIFFFFEHLLYAQKCSGHITYQHTCMFC